MGKYDLIIIGSGPAGLAAALYSARYNLKTLIISEKPGGEMANAPFIENYPGFKKISGMELVKKIEEQLKELKVKIELAKVEDIKKIASGFKVLAGGNKNFQAKAILLAIGMERRKLGVPGEKEYFGKGVAYCSTCDGPLFKDKIVAVAGGGDAGLASAFYLSTICKKVYVLEIMSKINAEPYWQNKIKIKKNVEISTGTKIKEILGTQFIQELLLENSRGKRKIKVGGIFIEIGSAPNTELAKKLGLKLDKKGFIIINQSGATSKKGIWAAGDTTTGSDYFWQILPSMAEGAIASHSIYKYLK